MAVPFVEFDKYTEPAVRFLLGILVLIAGMVFAWLSLRRKSAGLAVRAAGGLLGGTLLLLWALGVIDDLFSTPWGSRLILLCIFFMYVGYLFGRLPSEVGKRASVSRRSALGGVVFALGMIAGMFTVWIIAPEGYKSTAVLCAGVLSVFAIRLGRRYLSRRRSMVGPERSEGDGSPENPPGQKCSRR